MILKKKIYFALLCAGSYWLHHLILPTWNMSSHSPPSKNGLFLNRMHTAQWANYWMFPGLRFPCLCSFLTFFSSACFLTFSLRSSVSSSSKGFLPSSKGFLPSASCIPGANKGFKHWETDGLIWYFLLLGIVKATLFERYKDNLSIGAIIGKVIDK